MRSRKESRLRRHMRIRKRIFGTAERPRMAVMVSNKNIYVQFIDDDKGTTLSSATTCGKDGKCNVKTAAEFGGKAAQEALKKNIKSIVVDRGGYKFHGRIKAMVESMIKSGMDVGVSKDKEAK